MAYLKRAAYNKGIYSRKVDGQYQKVIHFKIQIRIKQPDDKFIWSRHVTLCGSEQDDIIPRNRFMKLAESGEYVCLRCVEYAIRLNDEIIEGNSTKELIYSGFEELFTFTQIRNFCKFHNIVLYVPRISFKTFKGR